MESGSLKLIGTWPCPNMYRTQLSLKIKSLDYEFSEENPHHKREIALINSPAVYKKAPILIHVDKPMRLSLVSVEYTDDARPNGPSLLPSGRYDRALALYWAHYIDDKWYPLLKKLREAEKEEREPLISKISEGLALLEEAFVKISKGKDYFGGDIIGHVDIVLGCTLGWFKVTEIVVEVQLLDSIKTPGLAKWAERFLSHKDVKDVLPKPEKLLEIFNNRIFVKTSAK